MAGSRREGSPASEETHRVRLVSKGVRNGPRGIEWSAITHLSFRSVVLQPDGGLQETQPRAAVKKLVDEAHSTACA